MTESQLHAFRGSKSDSLAQDMSVHMKLFLIPSCFVFFKIFTIQMSSSSWASPVPSSACNQTQEIGVNQISSRTPLESRLSLALSTISKPEATWSPSRQRSRNALGSPSSTSVNAPESNNQLEIRAGTGENTKIFTNLNRSLLCEASEYFAKTGQFIGDGLIELPEDDPVAVELFVKWIDKQQKSVKYDPDQYTPEPWPSKAVVAWMFARKIQARGFEQYAFSQFIQNCSILDFGPWEYIEKEVESGSPLSRFSDHWVAWNSALAGEGENEFTGLAAARLSYLVTSKTRDPRTFHILHWYLNCSDAINPKCLHDPIARQQFREQQAARRRKVEPVDERGRAFEAKRQNPRPAPASTLPASYIWPSTTGLRSPSTRVTNPYFAPQPLVYTQPQATSMPHVYPPQTSGNDDCAEVEACCESLFVCGFDIIEDCFNECCGSPSHNPPRYF